MHTGAGGVIRGIGGGRAAAEETACVPTCSSRSGKTPGADGSEIKGVMDGQFGAARHVWRTRAVSGASLGGGGGGSGRNCNLLRPYESV